MGAASCHRRVRAATRTRDALPHAQSHTGERGEGGLDIECFVFFVGFFGSQRFCKSAKRFETKRSNGSFFRPKIRRARSPHTPSEPMPRLRTPGPGAYEMPPHMTIGGSLGTRPTASFASNSKRSAKGGADATGDPGGYDIDRGGVHLGKKEAISARSKRSFNRDVNQGRGSFNSTTKRSTSAPPRSLRGGPGEHDYAHMYSCGSTASVQVTSSFLSASPLGGHVRKSDTPGVGEYEPNAVANKSFSREGQSMFAGSLKSRSVSSRSATGDHVGPGSYELEQSSIQKQMEGSANPRLPGFGSSSIRARACSTRSMHSPIHPFAPICFALFRDDPPLSQCASRCRPRQSEQLAISGCVRCRPRGDSVGTHAAHVQYLGERRQGELWHLHQARRQEQIRRRRPGPLHCRDARRAYWKGGDPVVSQPALVQSRCQPGPWLVQLDFCALEHATSAIGARRAGRARLHAYVLVRQPRINTSDEQLPFGDAARRPRTQVRHAGRGRVRAQ